MAKRRHRTGILGSLGLTAALLLVLACVTPGLPPAEPAGRLTGQTVQRVKQVYLYPEHLDRRFLVGALDALERRFEVVRFDEGKNDGVLWVGSRRARVPLNQELEPEEFQQILGQALSFVEPGVREELAKDEELDLEVIALRGALFALDRYSTIYAGRSTEDFKIRFSGKLKGIGARVGRRDGQLRAVKVFPDSPAEKGGLKDGDALLSIDDEPTQPLSVKEAVGKIRGKEGTIVRLGVGRDEEEFEVKITRGEVVVPSVKARLLEDGIGYVHITHMSRSTVPEFRKKLEELGELSGLVLDLRGNSGGSMRTSTTLADLFLKNELILRQVNRQDPTSSNPRHRTIAGPKVSLDYPTVVLVDRVTASGAEILAGAIAPLPRVQLVGQRTYGKGLIQRVYPLPEKHLLKLTVAEYILSGDREIHTKGIEPDIQLFPVSTKRLSRLANAPVESVPYILPEKKEDEEEDAEDEDENDFPIEVAQALLAKGQADPLPWIRAKADSEISNHLGKIGITWMSKGVPLPELLPKALRIKGESLRFVAGEPGTLRLKVENPNDFTIPDAWIALDLPASYSGDELLPLGDLAPGQVVIGELELTPPYGLSVPKQPVTVHVASGSRPLQSQRLLLDVKQYSPEIEIEVIRIAADRVEVTLKQRGDQAMANIKIAVPGDVSEIEELPPDTPVTKELRLSGAVDSVSVTLRGPGMRRQIEVPIPDERVTVVPPSVIIERGGMPGRRRLTLSADSPEGLSMGLIFLDGQKRTYVDWQGQRQGRLTTRLQSGDHKITARVETVSGVAVIDSWTLTAN